MLFRLVIARVDQIRPSVWLTRRHCSQCGPGRLFWAEIPDAVTPKSVQRPCSHKNRTPFRVVLPCSGMARHSPDPALTLSLSEALLGAVEAAGVVRWDILDGLSGADGAASLDRIFGAAPARR